MGDGANRVRQGVSGSLNRSWYECGGREAESRDVLESSCRCGEESRGLAPHREHVHEKDSGLLRRPLLLRESFSISPGTEGVDGQAPAGVVFWRVRMS